MSLRAELKRRNIFRVAAAYVVIGWLTLQVAGIVLGFTGAPDWVGKALIALLLLGAIPTLALAWVFEVGPEGIRIDDGRSQRDASPQARQLDVVTLGAVVLVVVLMIGQQLGPSLLDSDAGGKRAPQTKVQETPPADPAGADRSRLESDPSPVPEGSIAVLPFANRSSEPDTGYFVDGVHDDLLIELSRNPALTVISRTSVMEYRDTTKNLRQIAEELGVAHVLEGAVQRAGQRVRVNAQLIDAATDAQVWANSFDRELSPEGVFDIQTEIAAEIARALGRALGMEVATPARAAVTTSVEAFDAYLRARANNDVNSLERIQERIQRYEQALEFDPEFALAMGELGREYTNLYWYLTRREEDRLKGGEWIARALDTDPDNPLLMVARAEHLYRAALDYEGALAALARAEATLPGDARIFTLRAFVQRRAGRPGAAVEALRTAALLDPRSLETLTSLIGTYSLLGQIEAAREWNRRMMELPSVPAGVSLPMASVELSLRGDIGASIRAQESLPLGTVPAWAASTGFYTLGDSFSWRYLARDFEPAKQAIDIIEQTHAIIENQFAVVPVVQFRAMLAFARSDSVAQTRFAEQALRELDDILLDQPEDYRAWSQRGLVLGLLGRADEARLSSQRALDQLIPTRDAIIRSELMRQRAIALAFSADTAAVIDAVDSYLSLPMKFWSIHGLILDPAFDRHLDDPAFQALIARHRREDAAS